MKWCDHSKTCHHDLAASSDLVVCFTDRFFPPEIIKETRKNFVVSIVNADDLAPSNSWTSGAFLLTGLNLNSSMDK